MGGKRGADHVYTIVNVNAWQGNFEEAVQFFWKQWGSDSNCLFYRDCMEHALRGDDVPAFYLLLDKDRMIGGYALLRTDIVSRQDLTPWFACYFIEPASRGKNLGQLLQNHALAEVKRMGYRKLYLCTDLVNYYEKYDWRHIGEGYLLDDKVVRVYEHEVEV